MSREQKQQRRRERQRRNRSRRTEPSYEPVGSVRMPGVFGWFQNNPRIFYVGGITVMVMSLGAIFFATQGGGHSGTIPSSSDAADRIVAENQLDDAQDIVIPADGDDTEPAEEPIVRSYIAPPPMEIDTSHAFQAVIRTEKGDIRIELLPEEAPGYVNNFVFLARNRFYDGLVFHRVVPGFVAQAGDPTATGFGGAGYALPEEENDLPFEAGVLSMAKAGERVDGSQFFITLDPAPTLNDDFTVFGRVIEGMDVLRELTARNPAQPDQPAGDRILEIEIVEEEA